MKILTQKELERRILLLIRNYPKNDLARQEAKVGIYLGTQFQDQTIQEYLKYLCQSITMKYVKGFL